jgi:hypothetical protein
MHSTYVQQNVLTLSREVDECKPMPGGILRGGLGSHAPPSSRAFSAGAYTRSGFSST